MNGYIETRPEAIAAIHKCIVEKWNPICMGCVSDEPPCILCDIYFTARTCENCPLGKAGMVCNIDHNNPYANWDATISCDTCEHTATDCSDINCPIKEPRPAEAEAMLEALVQLLPESEREIYGG